ncbi:unnamed protein product [Miscanthus lutarioriparius]|uniref:Uncharacterized protein n=1 Tax=Miscanthus lutarioriparius TaxID=422564 RepID=A0A811PZA6_9POAL|nr:unnamed protein product [Miscanthus lutarioriparius]
MLCGTALQTAILLLVIWRTDWEAEAALAKERISSWSGECRHVVKQKQQQQQQQGETGIDSDLKDKEALALRV